MKALIVISGLLQAAPLLAQATNPPYLREIPPVERVLKDLQANDPDEAAARRMGTFLQFKSMIEHMAGDRFYRNQLTADEKRLIGVHYAAYWDIAKTKPEYQKFTGLKGYDINPAWRNELFTRYFSAEFKGKYEGVEADYAQRRAARAKADTENMLRARAEAAAAQQQMQGGGQNQSVRQLARCVASGRSESQCLSEGLVKDFRGMFGGLLPGGKGAPIGLRLSGVYSGQAGFKLIFWDEHAVVACGQLVADERAYTVELKAGQLVVGVKASPKIFELLQGPSQPFLLAMGPDGRLTGPGPTDITGRVQVGIRTWTRHYDDGRDVPMSEPVYETRTVRCNVGPLALAGAAPPIGTVSEGISAVFNLMSGGPDTIKPAPAGIRLNGEYGSQSAFDLEFHPHAVIVGCGDAVLARDYTVQVQGGQVMVRVLHEPTLFTLTYQPNGTLAGSGTVQVNGRVIVGRNGDELAYAPRAASCPLGVLAPAGQPQPPAATGMGGAGTAASAGPAAGNAVLYLESGFTAAPGAANPLAGKTFLLLDASLESVLTAAGLKLPPGTTAAKAVGAACANGMSPECQLVGTAMNNHSRASSKADLSGKVQFASLPAGIYYLVASTSYNGQPILWNLRVELKPGANSVRLDERTAAPMK